MPDSNPFPCRPDEAGKVLGCEAILHLKALYNDRDDSAEMRSAGDFLQSIGALGE